MSDKGWTSYVSQSENEQYGMCMAHRKRHELSIIVDIESLDCEDEICCKDCPLKK